MKRAKIEYTSKYIEAMEKALADQYGDDALQGRGKRVLSALDELGYQLIRRADAVVKES